MQPILTLDEQPRAGQPQLMIERFLRDSDGVWRQIKTEFELDGLIVRMLAHSTVALAGYGAVIGIGHSLLQSLASAVKLPLLFLLTLAICLPTLYFFNLLCGGRLSARQALALVLAAITVSSNLALAFAPITIFFMLTAPSYPFFLLLNVSILTLCSLIGLSYLVRGMGQINALDLGAPAEEERTPGARRSINPWLLWIWLLLYVFVGTQLGWTLRPVFGIPGEPFMLFRPIEGNFYVGIVEIILSLVR